MFGTMTDAILLQMKLRPGKTRQFVKFLPKVRERLDGSGATVTIFRRIFEWVLKSEGLYTESMFLKRTDDGDFVMWYMEAEDMNRFYETFEAAFESCHPLAIGAEKLIRTFFEEPEKALTYAENEESHELFIHGTNPKRP
jgi:hypothetical protein